MVIETKRLELVPLTGEQLLLWFSDCKELERTLNCSYQGELLDGFFEKILKEQYEITCKDPKNYVWHTFFLLIRKSDRTVVGSADFKDVPDEHGEVEIGYGLGKQFEHHGYMSEAVSAMCAWALRQDKVEHVIAETLLDNYASQRLLKRTGFLLYQEGESLWWRR